MVDRALEWPRLALRDCNQCGRHVIAHPSAAEVAGGLRFHQHADTRGYARPPRRGFELERKFRAQFAHRARLIRCGIFRERNSWTDPRPTRQASRPRVGSPGECVKSKWRLQIEG